MTIGGYFTWLNEVAIVEHKGNKIQLLLICPY